MTATNGRLENRCDICGRTWTVLAIWWQPGAGPFERATKYACIQCRPSGFDTITRSSVQPRLIEEAA